MEPFIAVGASKATFGSDADRVGPLPQPSATRRAPGRIHHGGVGHRKNRTGRRIPASAVAVGARGSALGGSFHRRFHLGHGALPCARQAYFELGGDWLRAIKYLQFGADIAGWRFEPRQAARILEHALELVKNLPEAERAEHQITMLEELARIYIAWVRMATSK